MSEIPDFVIFQVQQTDQPINDGSTISVLCCHPANESSNPNAGDQLAIEMCQGDAEINMDDSSIITLHKVLFF